MVSVVTSAKTSFLSDLLPYDTSAKKNGDLRAGLKEYQFLTQALAAAIAAYDSGELDKFDALVGENACQIRAVRTACIASKSVINTEDLRSLISLAQYKISALQSPRELSALMHSSVPLKEVLEIRELAIPLSGDETFLLEAYLLSEAREVKPSILCRKEVADPKKLKRFGDVSSGFVSDLVRKRRQNLAATSVEYVRDCAFLIQDKPLMHMVSADFTVKHNSFWSCTPMFWTYKVLLLTAQREGIPLVIHVKFKSGDKDGEVVGEDHLFFKVNRADSTYLETAPSAADLERSACVVEGVVLSDRDKLPSKLEWKAAILEHAITDVILAGAADHRQYPDSSCDLLVESIKDEEYERFKALAICKGFSLHNPTTFFIQHVYASKIGDVLESGTEPVALDESRAEEKAL